MTDWDACLAGTPPARLAGRLLRLVESQEQVATNQLVGSLERLQLISYVVSDRFQRLLLVICRMRQSQLLPQRVVLFGHYEQRDLFFEQLVAELLRLLCPGSNERLVLDL